MKARYSESYYRSNWARFMKESKESNYINLEEELEYRMRPYEALPEEAFKAIQKVEANKISERVTGELKNTMEIVKGIDAGTKSLGYTSSTQKANETERFIQRFEFNCIQLADFKKRYN